MPLSVLPFGVAEAARKSNIRYQCAVAREGQTAGGGGLLVLRGVLWGTRYGTAGRVVCGLWT